MVARQTSHLVCTDEELELMLETKIQFKKLSWCFSGLSYDCDVINMRLKLSSGRCCEAPKLRPDLYGFFDTDTNIKTFEQADSRYNGQ